LIGPNGAGKTTILNCVSGFVRPQRGAVRLNGRDLSALPPHRRAQLGVGRTFQLVGLAKTETVFTNLLVAQHMLLGYSDLEALARTPDPALVAPMVRVLARAAGAAGMVGGQELDLSPKAPLRSIHAMKTAALFSAACELGALAAYSPRTNELARFGRHLGLAFQLVDDILDFSEGGRPNFARSYGAALARRRAARELGAARAAIAFLGNKAARLERIAERVLNRNR
ncbi:MAG: polyprenyl synthetase family protein, partial [Planctomycetota bacterium]